MSTPPLGRTDSRTNLNDSSESEDTQLEKRDREKKGEKPADNNTPSGVPSTSNRPLKRTGTWTHSYMPKDKPQERTAGGSSDPLLSPRLGHSKKPTKDVSASPVYSSSSSTTPSASTNPPASSVQISAPSSAQKNETMVVNTVYANDLPPRVLSYVNLSLDKSGSLAPERIGELLVAVESKGQKIELRGDIIKRIMRGKAVINDFEPGSGGGKTNFNVIASICEPYMLREITTDELEKKRKKFAVDFKKIEQNFIKLIDETPKNEWQKSSRITDLMGPVMKGLEQIVCGEKNNLDTSALPDTVKKLLLSIDKHIIDWYQKNGTKKPADLYSARKNALIGFLATRSLTYVWKNHLEVEGVLERTVLTKLMAYTNSYLSTRLDSFVTNILLSQSDQPTEARKYIEVMTNRVTLKSKASVPTLKFGEALTGKGILSPRTPLTPVSQGSETDKAKVAKTAEKAEKIKLMKMRLEHARFIDDLAKNAGIDQIDYQCFQYVKDVVVKMSERGFDNFKKDPIRFYKKYTNEFYKDLKNKKRVDAGLPAKVINALDAYSLRLIGNPFGEVGDEPVKGVQSNTKAVTSKETEKSSETEPSDETEIETESSGEQSQS